MAYIGTSPSNGVRRVHTYTATASQTTFSGASSEGVTLSYVDTNYLDVYQNGILLGSADYTATSGTSVVLTQAASASDLVVIVVYDVFSVADTVSKANGGTFDNGITIDEDGATVLTVDRATSDGSIIDLQKDGTSKGNIGVWSSSLLLGTGDVGLAFVDGTPERIQPRKADDQTSADALIDLGHTSNRFKDLYLSGGAYIGGTGSANKLDDYEEGTYTPTVASTGTNPTVTYSKQEGNYTKIGNQVTVTGLIEFSAYTGNGGSFRLEGVPFNVATHTNYRAVGSVMIGSVATNLSGDYTSLQLSYNSGTSMQILMNNSVTGGVAETPANNIDAGTIIRYQLSYITLA